MTRTADLTRGAAQAFGYSACLQSEGTLDSLAMRHSFEAPAAVQSPKNFIKWNTPNTTVEALT